ncbi:MAG: photosystem II protein PsbQ [Kastovskya adunca ATA6-11-RM4]|jgi:photosystem II protein PsbQ|nr:photosystem II protein PsbQ [Kastovskya adunca ATA6-11-RM4]
MRFYRSILTGILVLVTTFLVSCGGPNANVPPPTYTAAQLEQIQRYAPMVYEFRDRLKDIPAMIGSQEWTDIQSVIHGPLGELRRYINYTARNFLPNDQRAALDVAKSLFNRLEALDQAAQSRDTRQSISSYNAAIESFDEFLELIPETTEVVS